MPYLTKSLNTFVKVWLLIIMGVFLSSCGSVAELRPPENFPKDFPSGTVYPKIDKPVNDPIVSSDKNSLNNKAKITTNSTNLTHDLNHKSIDKTKQNKKIINKSHKHK